MSETARFQEVLRRLAIMDEGFVNGHARLDLGLPGYRPLDPKTAALVQVGALAAIAPAVGLGRVVGAVPGVAAALGYDVETALVSPDDQ
jgi:hypothetical protein